MDVPKFPDVTTKSTMEDQSNGVLRLLSLSLMVLLAGCFGGERPREHSILATRSDKAIVCFYRPAKDSLAARGYTISEKGDIARLSNGTCCFVYVSPGEHVFKMDIPVAPEAYCKINAVPGQTYYILCDSTSGLFTNKPVFELVERSLGESRIYTLRQKEPLE
jgi:hypothetical protein